MTSRDASSLGQQILNKAAEIGLSTQLDVVESMTVDVHTDPLKLAQGEVDSVAVTGDGLVILSDLRLEELQLQTGSIGINLLSAILGKIELTQPTDAKVRVVLTEADLNRALNSDFIRTQVRQTEIQVADQIVKIDLQQAECSLPGEHKIALTANFLLTQAAKTYPVHILLVLCISEQGAKISIQRSQYVEGKDLPIELTAALLTKISEVLNQRYYKQEELWLHVEQLVVEAGRVTLHINLHVDQFPVNMV